MKVNLGSGDYPAPPPWVNVDSTEGPWWKPDVVCDVRNLLFDDDSVEMVYCGHLLEHLPLEEVPATLREIRRVLKPDGKACFVGPDYDRAIAQDWPENVLTGIRDGGHRWPGDEHRWLSTAENSLELIRSVFPDAAEVDLSTLPPTWPCPFPDVTWQFAILT